MNGVLNIGNNNQPRFSVRIATSSGVLALFEHYRKYIANGIQELLTDKLIMVMIEFKVANGL